MAEILADLDWLAETDSVFEIGAERVCSAVSELTGEAVWLVLGEPV